MVYEKPRKISMVTRGIDIGSSLVGSIGKGKVFI